MRFRPCLAFLALLPLCNCAPNGTWGAGNTCASLDNDRAQVAALEEHLARLRAQPPDSSRQKEIQALERRKAMAQEEIRRMQSGCRPSDLFQPKERERRN